MFCFSDGEMSDDRSFIVTLSAEISSKAALLKELATGLRFPDYFGENWDALDECICDLSWLPPGRVVIRHRDLPLSNDPREAEIYLSILNDAVEEFSTSESRSLVVKFPASARDRILSMIRVP